MAIWNKYFWKQSRLHWDAGALLRAVFAIYSQCVVSRWRRPATARPGRAASWRKTTASSTATCSAPASTGSASSQAPAHVRPSHPVWSFAWVDSRLYPVLSDYLQLYWCLASIKYKIDNFIFTFKHDTFKHIICFVCRGARGEESQWGRFNDLSSGSPARTSPGGPTGTRRGAHHHNCCLRRQTCISKCCLFVTVTCWSQIRHCPTHCKLPQILNCDGHGTHITVDRQSICNFNPTCHTTQRNPCHLLCGEV